MSITLAQFASDALTALWHLSPAEVVAALGAVVFATGGLFAVRALHTATARTPVNQVPRGPVYRKAA